MHLDPWTLALQTVNVLVLVWLLARFLFRPVAAVIAARRQAADKLLADAEAVRQHALDEATALARQRDGLASEGQHIIADARAAAEAERATLLQHAAEAAARTQADARQAMARDERAMSETLEREAGDLAVTIATRLLQRLPPQALNRAFVQAAAETLTTHPARASLAGAELDLCSAVPLDAAAQADSRDILTRAIGGKPQVSFRTDPALIAGIEITGPDVLIRNSWRADLDRIARALQQEESHAAPRAVA